MSYLNRSTSKRTAGSAELVYLFVVLAAGVATAWWIGQQIGFDLSSLKAVPTLMGIGQTVRPLSGYEARAEAAAAPDEIAVSHSSAPYCNPGQTPSFVLGVAALKQQLGERMGEPVECEHPSTASGDTVQQTTTGLAAYHQRTNTVTFTDGWQHWALTPGGVISWKGTQSEPPSPNS